MSDIRWIMDCKAISYLKENSKNPRQLSKKQALQLQTSIEKFGVCEPIIIQPDGTIIGGHQRVKILKKLKREYVDVYVPSRELTEEEKDELTIRLNKNTGDWDYDVLANSWDTMKLLEWGFDLEEFGISKEEKEEEKEICPTCGKKITKKSN